VARPREGDRPGSVAHWKEYSTAHSPPSTNPQSLKEQRVTFAQASNDEGKADNGLISNPDNPTLTNRWISVYSDAVELALHGTHKRLGIGEALNDDNPCPEMRCRRQFEYLWRTKAD
jgi:hypothetical protein